MVREENTLIALGKTILVGMVFLVLCSGLQELFAHNDEKRGGTIRGRVLDVGTLEGIAFAQVVLSDLSRSTLADVEGRFQFSNVPSGAYQLTAFRLGYHKTVLEVRVQREDTVWVELRLQSSSLMNETVIVTAKQDKEQLGNPIFDMSGTILRQNLGKTIAETLENEPGMAQRTMGPAPARPVMRGLGGDRLLVLEDGGRTGDLSASSADHAVVIEPLTAERIEVLRGASALMYGSNAMGGVVNVVNENILKSRPQLIQTVATVQGETVNSGYSGGIESKMPLGEHLALRFGATRRASGDVYTPTGRLMNTEMDTYRLSAGLSYVKDWGVVGVSGNLYSFNYGIPGGFAGGHPNGVDIQIQRHYAEMMADWYPTSEWIHHVSSKNTFARYAHDELESDGSLGIRFSVLTFNSMNIIHLKESDWLGKPAIGIWQETRDHLTSGFSNTPQTFEATFGTFLFTENEWKNLKWEGILRYDYRLVNPYERRFSLRVGDIRRRDFDGFSSAFSATYVVTPSLEVGAGIMRTFRAPGVEELFMEGPHLAAFSYEVGNADLNAETGIGTDLFVRFKTRRFSTEMAFFRNHIRNYIFPRSTGQPSYQRNDLIQYEYYGQTAILQGFEWSYSWRMGAGFSTSGNVNYVHGTLSDGIPLPFIPPLGGKMMLNWQHGAFSVYASTVFADEQQRLGEFELPTDGFVMVNTGVNYFFTTAGRLHTLHFGIENLGNTEYRRHLSRVKEVMPEPGRNVKMLYKVYF